MIKHSPQILASEEKATTLCMKGEPVRRDKLAWKHGKRFNISIYRLPMVVLAILMHNTFVFCFFFLFFFLRWICAQGASTLVCSLPTQSRKRAACDVMCTSATHAGHIHHVTDLMKLAALTSVSLKLINIDFLPDHNFIVLFVFKFHSYW